MLHALSVPANKTESPASIGTLNALMAIDQSDAFDSMESALTAYWENATDSLDGTFAAQGEALDAFKAAVKSKLGRKAPKGWC